MTPTEKVRNGRIPRTFSHSVHSVVEHTLVNKVGHTGTKESGPINWPSQAITGTVHINILTVSLVSPEYIQSTI